MEIEAVQYNARLPVTVFRIRGDLGAQSSDILLQKAREAHGAGMSDLLLDLTHVDYMSSAGLKAIHQIFSLLRTQAPEETDDVVRKRIVSGGYVTPYLKLLSPSRHVLQTLKLAGYDMFLEIFTDLEKAIASF